MNGRLRLPSTFVIIGPAIALTIGLLALFDQQRVFTFSGSRLRARRAAGFGGWS
jgi:hypothetical protein